MIQQPEPLNWASVRTANIDLDERLFREGVEFAYDEDGDTLFVTIGDAKGGITKHAIDDVYVVVDPETLKISGCTILSFNGDFMGRNKLFRKLFPDVAQILKAAGGTLGFKGNRAEKAKVLFDAAMLTCDEILLHDPPPIR